MDSVTKPPDWRPTADKPNPWPFAIVICFLIAAMVYTGMFPQFLHAAWWVVKGTGIVACVVIALLMLGAI